VPCFYLNGETIYILGVLINFPWLTEHIHFKSIIIIYVVVVLKCVSFCHVSQGSKIDCGGSTGDEHECMSKDGRTPTASKQASRHETKETKADVSIMTQTDVRRFS
jgi:hypothetical protein